jgi:hypothetical protein
VAPRIAMQSDPSRINPKYFLPILSPDWILLDGNQQASLEDPLHILVGPIIRARSKMIKEATSGLIQDIWAGSKMEHSNLGPKEDEEVINLVQAIDGADHA